MASEMVKISIVTVCRNSEQFLSETIESVIKQTYSNIEYIVIDGASTDGTLDIIKKYSAHIHFWMSEPDTGMYEAMNKGLERATGDYILNLNSDDLLASDDAISKVAEAIGDDRPDYFYGDLIKFKEGKYRKIRLFSVNFMQLLLSKHLTFASHPCFFVSAKLNKVLGGYNSNFKNASDYDYVLRAMSVPGVKGRHINVFISIFRIHENNTYFTVLDRINRERMEILTTYGYFKQPYLKRVLFYYSCWIYYKVINIANGYR